MKRWFLTALALILAGLVMAGISISKDGLERFIVTEDEFEKAEYVFSGDVSDIFIDDSSQDIEIIALKDGECRLEYYKDENDMYDISLEDGVLKVKRDEKFGILPFADFGVRVMRLYLPEGEYSVLTVEASSSDVKVESGLVFTEITIDLASGDVCCSADAENLRVRTASGEVMIDGAEADGLSICTASGDIAVSDSGIGDVGIDTSSGKVTLNYVKVLNEIVIGTSSGDVEFAGLDAGYIEIDSTSGDVEGSVVKAMQYETDTASGDIAVPVSERNAAVCRVETTSGDITIVEK